MNNFELLTFRAKVAAGVLTLTILLLLSSCGFGGSSAETPTPSDLSADEILEQSATRWDETETVGFDLQIEGATYLDTGETIELRSAEGQIKRPDQALATANVKFGFVNFEVSLVFLGDDAYMTDILTGSWGNAPGDFSYNPGVIMDLDSGVSAVLRQMDKTSIAGEDVIDGKPAYHIIGTVPDTLINSMTAGGLQGDEIDVDIWVDQSNYDVLKLTLTAPSSGDEEGTVWILELFDHNDPLTIERPVT